MVLCWSAYFLALQFWCHLLLSFFCGISVPFLRSHHLSLFPQSNFQILYMVFCKNIGVHRWPNKTKSSWRMGVLYGCADQTTKSMFANNCSCPGHATWIKMGPYTSLHLVISTNSKIPHSRKKHMLSMMKRTIYLHLFFAMHLLSKLHCIKRRNVTLPKYYFYIRFSYTDSSTDTKK